MLPSADCLAGDVILPGDFDLAREDCPVEPWLDFLAEPAFSVPLPSLPLESETFSNCFLLKMLEFVPRGPEFERFFGSLLESTGVITGKQGRERLERERLGSLEFLELWDFDLLLYVCRGFTSSNH